MRILFALHAHRLGAKVPLTMKRLVQLATLDGAVDLGIADRTGSLVPGKRADIILVRATDINMTPPGDPYEGAGLARPAGQHRHGDRGRAHPAQGRRLHRARPRQSGARGPGGGPGAPRQGELAAGVVHRHPGSRVPGPRAGARLQRNWLSKLGRRARRSVPSPLRPRKRGEGTPTYTSARRRSPCRRWAASPVPRSPPRP